MIDLSTNADILLYRLASGGVPRVLTPEEEAERQALKEAKIASQAQQKELMAKATAETPAEMTQEQVEKRLEKERIKEERRIAYEADQAEKRAAWFVGNRTSFNVLLTFS